jgi:alpha-D-xyloside xylohydrolase
MSRDAFNRFDYDVVGNLTLVEAGESSAIFSADGTHIEISAHQAGTFRLRLGKTARPDYGLLVKQKAEGRLTVEPIESGWRLTHGDVALVVTPTPFRIALEKNGRTIATSITDQHFRGGTRIPAFARDAKNGKWCAALALESDTAVYGFGEKFGTLDKRGQLVRGWIEDALGVNTEISYKTIPFFWTTDGWGMLIHSTGLVRHGVGYPQWSHRSYVAEVDDDALDIFLFVGDPTAIIDGYAALTGRPALPPLWGYGMWLSRAYYKTPQEAIDVAAELRQREIPCDVITLDGRAAWEVKTRFTFDWDKSRFDNPQKTLATLKSYHLKVCVWEYPYVSIHSPLFNELAAKGWLLKNADGSAAVFEWEREPGAVKNSSILSVLTPLPASGILDFTMAEASRYWADRHNALFDDGVDVMKTDFGEQVSVDMVASNGDTGRHLHNVYPLLYNRCVFDATQRYNDKHGRGAAMVWGRDGFIGSQRYPMQWGGDPQTDWEAMAASIRAGLGYGMSGVPYYATDIGGFYGEQQPDAELFLRWTANGIFCSHFRYHGIGAREPWAFGAAAEGVAKKLLAFRYRLIPYMAGAAEQAARTGLPLMRAMPLAFPRDRVARSFEGQYLFGDALLVAPIIRAGGSVEVYFPAGEAWHDLDSGERIEGGQVRVVQKALDELPAWGREGHMLCLGRAVMHTGEMDLAAPVEEVRLFGEPRAEPCVMNRCVTLSQEDGVVRVAGVVASQCRVSRGFRAVDDAGRVRIERQQS